MINIRMQPADDTLFWEGGGYYLYPSEAVLNKTFQNEIASYIYDMIMNLQKFAKRSVRMLWKTCFFITDPTMTGNLFLL